MIHPSHRQELPAFFGWLLVLVASLLLVTLLPAPHVAQGVAGYLPFHIAIEVAAITVASLVFGIAWSVQRYRPNGRALVLGLAFLAVAAFDLSHVLSFAGMPDYVTEADPEKAIHFWLVARICAAVGLLFVAFVPTAWTTDWPRPTRYAGLLGVLLLVGVVHYLVLWMPQVLPRTFIAGQGLTAFKIYTEYVLIGTYLLAGLAFMARWSQPRDLAVTRLALAAFTMAMGEYFFTIYANVTDVYNVTGHVYKIIAYGFLYRALFVETVQQPYEALLASEEQQRATLDTLPDLLFEMDSNGRYLAVHAQDDTKLAGPTPKLLGKSVHEVLSADAAAACMAAIADADRLGASKGRRMVLDVPDGHRHFELSVSKTWNRATQAAHFLVLSRDITTLVDNEAYLAFEARLNTALLDLQQHDGLENETVFMQRGVEHAERITDSRIAFIHFVHDDQNTIELVTWSRATLETYCHAVHQTHYPVSEAGIWAEALRQKRPVVFNDYAQAPHKKGLPDGHAALYRLISLPVIEGGKVRMLMGVGNKAKPYTDRDVQAMQVLADAIWNRTKEHRQAAVIHRLSEALGQSPNPVLITDLQGSIQYINPAFTVVSGYESYDVLGKNPRLLQSGETPKSTYQQLWAQLTQGRPWQGEFINRRKDGRTYVERASLYPIKNPFGEITHYVAHKEDITAEREIEARIRSLSDFDALTGLYNKKSFDEQLWLAIERTRSQHGRLSLLWMDLDNFKAINETLGHAAGDELLVEMGNRLRETLGTAVVLARYSGDAFVAIVPNQDQAAVALMARDCLDTLQASMVLQDSLVSVGASIGIAIYPDDANSAGTLASAAEVAMYRVKQEGRNGLRFFSADIQATTQRSLELAASLKEAVARQELFVVYQPQCGLEDGRLLGAEALLRWRHPKWGLISPAEFIPIAEQTGLIVPIGAWVVDHVAHQLRQWQDAGLPPITVAVNVSAVQFARAQWVDELLHTVQQAGVSPAHMEIELTEAVALKAPELAAATLHRLHQAGFQIALDDFGTGYSSMSYLRRYAIDKLKIDQSFVRELSERERDQAIVRAIVQMAHSLGLRTIAEGVETADHVNWLKACGCDEMQGYWFSRPLDTAAFEAFVRGHGAQSGRSPGESIEDASP